MLCRAKDGDNAKAHPSIKASKCSWTINPMRSSTLGMLDGSCIRELRGTWSSAKPSPSSSLAAPVASDGGPLGLPAAEEEGAGYLLGVVARSDMKWPASLEGAMFALLSWGPG